MFPNTGKQMNSATTSSASSAVFIHCVLAMLLGNLMCVYIPLCHCHTVYVTESAASVKLHYHLLDPPKLNIVSGNINKSEKYLSLIRMH